MKDVEQYFEAQFAAIDQNKLDVSNVANVNLFYIVEIDNGSGDVRDISLVVNKIPMLEISDEKFANLEFVRHTNETPIFKAVA